MAGLEATDHPHVPFQNPHFQFLKKKKTPSQFRREERRRLVRAEKAHIVEKACVMETDVTAVQVVVSHNDADSSKKKSICKR